jgi:hypothetical protein
MEAFKIIQTKTIQTEITVAGNSYDEVNQKYMNGEYDDIFDDAELRQWNVIDDDYCIEEDDIDEQEVEEFARKCDITQEGMNEGWCWGDGSFYTKYKKDTLVQCSRDRDSIIEHWNASETNHLNDMIGEDNVKVLQALLDRDELTSTDLLEMGYASDYLYYTEWEDEDDYQYVMVNGILIEKE